MKFMRSSFLLAATVAVSAIAVTQAEIRPGIATAGVVDAYDEAFAPTYSSRFRYLQAGSLPTDPTTAPPTSPTPPPTTPTPTTPTPTTPDPTTPDPSTATPEPSSETPAPTTATPEPTTPGETPTETPEPDTSVEAPDSGSNSSSQVITESSGDGGSTDKASSSSNAGTGVKDTESGANTITIVAIVGGIVVGVALLAFVAVTCARRRRDDDDDPLSPFELSMDKGYNGAPTYNNNNQNNQNNNNSALAYSGVRTTTNNSGAVAFGAGVGAGVAAGGYAASQEQYNNTAAGVNYNTQFYDVTSPGSGYHQQEKFKKQSSEEIQANDTSLWMSAMEPKDQDAEGASVPPEMSILGENASFMSTGSRNSYDAVSEEIDIDQSSVLSGGSDLEKEFPDYEDESSRGSYEL